MVKFFFLGGVVLLYIYTHYVYIFFEMCFVFY